MGAIRSGFFLLGLLLSSRSPSAQERVGPEELAALDAMRRRGENSRAERELDEILEENPSDLGARALRARVRFQACEYADALEDAQVGLEAMRAGEPDALLARAALRVWLELSTELGRGDRALEAMGESRARLAPAEDARDAWALGFALLESGRRSEARTAFEQGLTASSAEDWEQVAARGRCERALGLFERAAKSFVRADQLAAHAATGADPDVLVALGELYFEAYGEVDDPVSKAHSPAELARAAQALAPEHEGARLLLARLHRFNWQRTSQTCDEILAALFAARPDSIPGLVLKTSVALDDGDLPTARGALERLARLAPARRDVRAEQAALAWIEHRRDEASAALAELVRVDPQDSRPELAVGLHLLELYRFAEALPFCERATERDPRDWMAWIQLGRARANTGDEEHAFEALQRSTEVGEGRRNAWRDNTLLVLARMRDTMVKADHGPLRFLWRPDEGRVLEHYLPDFYRSAREELAARYGHTPGPTQIEVFHDWEDFSVRSTGFQGYPALGVCFGPVVTAVSPLCELRATFSWARTSFHEFTHVIHLGLSNNRCPRWITEGLATWEEGARRKAWWRNMRRDLVDALANGEVFPLRRLNNAFRGPSVLFAYYQSGLLCQMLIERSGFSPMVRLLEAFDRGADLDQAFQQVFARTPETIDEEFAGYAAALVAPLQIEPRWSQKTTFARRFRLARTPPEGPAERTRWSEEWCRVAWGSYAAAQRVDAQEALRLAGLGGALPARGEFLRGELALARSDSAEAMAAFERGFALGGEEYRARMALGSLLARRSKAAEARAQFEAAERAFPGFPDPHFSAELELARLHEQAGELEPAMAARERWLAFNAGDFGVHARVAEWLTENERYAESARLWEAANEIDPFRRHLHYAWGRSLAELGRHAEALREFRVGLLVSSELDGDVQAKASEELPLEQVLEVTGLSREEWDRLAPLEQVQRLQAALAQRAQDGNFESLTEARFRSEEPLLHGEAALAALALGKFDEARASVTAALALDPKCKPALEAQGKLP